MLCRDLSGKVIHPLLRPDPDGACPYRGRAHKFGVALGSSCGEGATDDGDQLARVVPRSLDRRWDVAARGSVILEGSVILNP